jgi:hypothetical protein
VAKQESEDRDKKAPGKRSTKPRPVSAAAAVDDSQFVFTFTAPHGLNCQLFNSRIEALELGSSGIGPARYGVVHVSKPLGKLALFDLIEEYNRVAPEELRMKNLKCFTMGEVDKQPLHAQIWLDRIMKPVESGPRSVWVNPRG